MKLSYLLLPLALILAGCEPAPPDMSSGHAYIFSKEVVLDDLASSNATYVVYASYNMAVPTESVAVTVEMPMNLGNPGDMLVSSNNLYYAVPSKVRLPTSVDSRITGTIYMDLPTIQIVSKSQDYNQRLEHKAVYQLSGSLARGFQRAVLILPDNYGEVGQYARFTADGKLYNVDTNKIELERTR